MINDVGLCMIVQSLIDDSGLKRQSPTLWTQTATPTVTVTWTRTKTKIGAGDRNRNRDSDMDIFKIHKSLSYLVLGCSDIGLFDIGTE